jgi:hypothetical protein
LIGGALQQAAQAVVVYSDDFQDEVLATTFPAIGGSNVGDPYVAFDSPSAGSANIFKTRGTLTVTVNPEVNGNTSSQVLRGVRENSTTAPQFVRVAAPFAGGIAPLDGLTLSVDIYNPTPVTANTANGMRIGFISTNDPLFTTPFGSRPTSTFTVRDLFTFVETDTTFQIDGTPDVGVNYGADTWQNFSMTLALSDDILTTTTVEYTANWKLTNLETTATINGSKIVGIANNFDSLGVAARGLMFEFAGTSNNVAYVDNVSVTAIPEPTAYLFGSLASCLGGLGWFLRRKRLSN